MVGPKELKRVQRRLELLRHLQGVQRRTSRAYLSLYCEIFFDTKHDASSSHTDYNDLDGKSNKEEE